MNDEFTEWQMQMIECMENTIDSLRIHKGCGAYFPLFTDNYIEAFHRLAWLRIELLPLTIRQYNISVQLSENDPTLENGIYWANLLPI